jgi:hypothetical protein
VKRIGADERAIVFQLGARERSALVQILDAYPVVPPAHQPLSKELKDPEVAECQRLLDEALAEQRAANKQHLQDWLATPERFQKTKSGYRFTLERADSEWLLQVLNDIRVGNWLRLGSPPEGGELMLRRLNSKRLPIWMAMHLSGYFQMTILQALEG